MVNTYKAEKEISIKAGMLNEKNVKTINKIFVVSMIAIYLLQVTIPLVSAYTQGIPAMNLWELFIDNVFGNFWMAVIGLMLLFSVILMMGSISGLTNMMFNGIFLFSMAMGYGYPLITIPFFIAIIFWSIAQMMQFINRIGY